MTSMTWSAFLRSLREQGYEVKTGVKHIAIRPPGKERFVRLRSLGEDYTEEAIRQKILGQRAPVREPKPEPKKVLHIRVQGDFRLSKVTWRGFRALYFFYLRKLRAAQRQPQERTSYLLRDDLRKLDKINEQTKFLFTHKIDTGEQLADYRQEAEKQIAFLLSVRTKLNNEKHRTGISDDRQGEIGLSTKSISALIKGLRRDVKTM